MSQRTNERGAALVIVALFATALALITGLTANVGMMVYQRTKLQAAADAAALAGAWSLDFGDAQAIAAAKEYALSNGFTLQDQDVSVQGSQRVNVKLSQPVGLLLGDFLSRQNMTVGAASSAQFELISRGLRPLAIADPMLVDPPAVPQDFKAGEPYVIKRGPQDAISGNFTALDLEGGGAKQFERTFKFGTDHTFQIPEQIPTQTGNMFGSTERAAEWLMAKNPDGTYEQALSLQNPSRDPRVIAVVLVDPEELATVSGTSQPVTVKGFANFWLDYDPTAKGEVKAYYIGRITDQKEMPGTKYHAKLQLVL